MNEIETYVRASAQRRGIDPEVAVRVARSEGGLNDPVRQSDYVKNGVREPSYGPFQLYMGGGLGNRALAAGIDPRDPAHWQAGVDFALNEAARKGWGQWYGAARVGIGNRQGIGGASAGPVQAVDMQPAMQAQPAPGPSSYMQAIMGVGQQQQGGGSQFLQTGTSDALIADLFAGRNPLRQLVMQKVMSLFA